MSSVLIADDHPAVRRSIRRMLEAGSDVEIIGEAANGQEAVDRACTLHPDLVIMDLNMPRMDGLSATEEIKRRCRDVRVLMLSMFDSDATVDQARASGVDGYVTKGQHAATLLLAIASVLHNEPFFPSNN